jgi:LysM repeat protein
MAKVTVSAGQSLLDVAMWQLGGVEALFALADANDLGITDPIQAGQVLTIPDGAVVNPELVAYYQEQNLRINTADPARVVAAPVVRDFNSLDKAPQDFA